VIDIKRLISRENLRTVVEIGSTLAAALVGLGYMLLPSPSYDRVIRILPYLFRTLFFDLIILSVLISSLYFVVKTRLIKDTNEYLQILDASLKVLAVIPIFAIAALTAFERASFWENHVLDRYATEAVYDSVELSRQEGPRDALRFLQETDEILGDHPSAHSLKRFIATYEKRVVRSTQLLGVADVTALNDWNPVDAPLDYFRVLEVARLNSQDEVASGWLADAVSALERDLIPRDVEKICNGIRSSRHLTVKTDNAKMISVFRDADTTDCSEMMYSRWKVESVRKIIELGDR
jgi:hypothetical protein